MLFQRFCQMRGTHASGFFVISKCKMDGLMRGCGGKVVKLSHTCGNKTFHIATAPTINQTVLFGHGKWITAPVLIGHWHHIRMAG